MQTHTFKTLQELEFALENVRNSPKQNGRVRLIVTRPGEGQRVVLTKAELTTEQGLVGDSWKTRGYRKGPANIEMQVNIMNVRAIAAIENIEKRWPLAGDQFFVDFDISKDNLPAGTKIKIGSATLLVTEEPHLGCLKFSERFGKDAVLWVNSDEGKKLNLRGINAKVLAPGEVRAGGTISKL